MSTERYVSPREAAMLLQARLETLGWIFSLDKKGRLHLVIGDDQPGVPQHVLMEVLGLLAPEFQTLLGDTRRH
jgi:hypothetical protein